MSFSQNIDNLFTDRGEIYFSFQYKNTNQLNTISDIISIDHKTNDTLAFAYANKKEYIKFRELWIKNPPHPFRGKTTRCTAPLESDAFDKGCKERRRPDVLRGVEHGGDRADLGK